MTIENPLNKDIILNYTENFTVPTVGYKANFQLVNEVLNKVTQQIYSPDKNGAMILGYSINISHDAESYLHITVNINFYGDNNERNPSIIIHNIKKIFVEYMTVGE